VNFLTDIFYHVSLHITFFYQKKRTKQTKRGDNSLVLMPKRIVPPFHPVLLSYILVNPAILNLNDAIGLFCGPLIMGDDNKSRLISLVNVP
jgi:hypothetical protein